MHQSFKHWSKSKSSRDLQVQKSLTKTNPKFLSTIFKIKYCQTKGEGQEHERDWDAFAWEIIVEKRWCTKDGRRSELVDLQWWKELGQLCLLLLEQEGCYSPTPCPAISSGSQPFQHTGTCKMRSEALAVPLQANECFADPRWIHNRVRKRVTFFLSFSQYYKWKD